IHVVFSLEAFEIDLELLQTAFDFGRFWHERLPEDQEPDERQPELARVWQRTIVDEHVGVGRSADEFEQLAQAPRVTGPETRAMAKRGAGTGLAVLGGREGNRERAIEVGTREGGKDERDRKRPRLSAEKRLVEIGIESGQLLVRRLLGKLGVRPETFQ